MIISNNMSAMYAGRVLNETNGAVRKDLEKLSSGSRINRAGDDAAGLAVSERMRSQIRGLNQASKNVQNTVSMVQSAEGYLQGTQDILQRLRELAVQSANGVYSSEDRMQVQVEVSQLVDEVNRIASHGQFNGMSLLNGTYSKQGGQNIYVQMGANAGQGESLNIENMSAEALGLTGAQGGVVLDSTENATRALSTLDTALKVVSKQRADLGGYQSRLEMSQRGTDIASENLVAAESRIRDTDMATTMVDYTKNSILQQSAMAMLGQANTQPNSILRLLG